MTKDFLKKIEEETSSTIAIDFDDVIHKNSKGFYDGTIYDDPIVGTKEALKFLSEKYNLIIFTCKADPDRPLVNGKIGPELIWEWLEKHNLKEYITEITYYKPRASYYIDDKSVKFESWKQVLDEM